MTYYSNIYAPRGTDMSARMHVCARMLRVLALALAWPAALAGAPDLTFTSSARVPGADMARVLDPATAYNIVYRWNRFGRIMRWTYSEDPEHRVQGMRCAHASFTAELAVPDFFAAYLPVQTMYEINMQKKVCVYNNVITEVSRLQDTAFLSDFKCMEISRLKGHTVTTTADLNYSVPWYLSFLKPKINTYLQKSIEDHLQTMYVGISGDT